MVEGRRRFFWIFMNAETRVHFDLLMENVLVFPLQMCRFSLFIHYIIIDHQRFNPHGSPAPLFQPFAAQIQLFWEMLLQSNSEWLNVVKCPVENIWCVSCFIKPIKGDKQRWKKKQQVNKNRWWNGGTASWVSLYFLWTSNRTKTSWNYSFGPECLIELQKQEMKLLIL